MVLAGSRALPKAADARPHLLLFSVAKALTSCIAALLCGHIRWPVPPRAFYDSPGNSQRKPRNKDRPFLLSAKWPHKTPVARDLSFDYVIPALSASLAFVIRTSRSTDGHSILGSFPPLSIDPRISIKVQETLVVTPLQTIIIFELVRGT